ncbi:glycerol-3-phosphate dehydrogenase/oxidase [Granulicella sp. dw_53]|uniref:glycerol-3-phosphate dehydrogenase/oxidase n=1 Tax=Granulicella sp. dw_53 TaxID=2719792 RepID=UPI001BD48C2C|nr:glycerol-3-phosphate dehydrogenase/oxidase [Granulicella sp. dw_53]
MERVEVLRRLGEGGAPWDVLILGGGATGLGTAVEAASRGLRTVLVERYDFAKGTSSRSTKLVHGGVRYLEQMNVTLVLDALRERGYMLRNAPHLVRNLGFVIPAYDLLSLPYYAFGLKVYEMLSGKLSLGPSKALSRERTMELLPGVKADGLRGGVLYQDGQFDDARYAIALLRTFQDLGGTAINYVEAVGLIERDGKVIGARVRDGESGEEFELAAKAVINATGVFTEQVLGMEGGEHEPLLTVSQGSHIVLPREFLPGSSALMIPKTSDGRVLFAIPWHEAVIVGTTDEGVPRSSVEPRAMAKERSFLTEYVGRYMGRRPEPSEVRSVWSGLRPLVRKGGGKTSKLSRDHTILVSKAGMITVTGGKWTTYRKMGEDAIDRAVEVHGLPKKRSTTAEMRLHGWVAAPLDDAGEWEAVYGADLPALRALIASDARWGERLHPRLPYRVGEIVWAARFEMARTVEDVLARRMRALFLDARAAMEAAPVVARVLAEELGRSDAEREWDLERFYGVARGYVYEES